jgi:hypothetical protein
MDCDASHFVALEFDLTGVDPGASGEAVGGGGVEYGRGATHGMGGAVKENEEAVTGGLHFASAEALDVGAHRLVVLRQQ